MKAICKILSCFKIHLQYSGFAELNIILTQSYWTDFMSSAFVMVHALLLNDR